MKFGQLKNQYVFAGGYFKVCKLKDVIVDAEEWKVTHLELEPTKEASEQILGVRPTFFDLPKKNIGNFRAEKRNSLLH